MLASSYPLSMSPSAMFFQPASSSADSKAADTIFARVKADLNRCEKEKLEERIAVVTVQEIIDLFLAKKMNNIARIRYSAVFGEASGPGLELQKEHTSQKYIDKIVVDVSLESTKGLKLLDVCRLSKICFDLSRFILKHYFSLFRIFADSSDDDTSWRPKWLQIVKDFVGDITYQDLKTASSFEFISTFVSNFSLYENKLPFLKDYAKEFIENLIDVPELLLKPHDFKKAVGSTHEIEKKTEGHWFESKRSEEAYQYALAYRKDFAKKSPEEKRVFMEVLQKLTQKSVAKFKEEKTTTEPCLLPLPQIEPWEGQEHFLKCLELLEKLSDDFGKINPKKELLLLAFPDETAKVNELNLLFSHVVFAGVRQSGPGGYLVRLPTLCPDSHPDYLGSGLEYAVTLKDGTLLQWTGALRYYIRDYNVIPSKGFLQKFSQFLNECKEIYSKDAQELKKMLQALPQTVEKLARVVLTM